jgi:hypothetical protein
MSLNLVENFLEDFNKESKNIITKIFQKDLKCGLNKKIINKAFPKLIPKIER